MITIKQVRKKNVSNVTIYDKDSDLVKSYNEKLKQSPIIVKKIENQVVKKKEKSKKRSKSQIYRDLLRTSQIQQFHSEYKFLKEIFNQIQNDLFNLYKSDQIRTNSLSQLRKKYKISNLRHYNSDSVYTTLTTQEASC